MNKGACYRSGYSPELERLCLLIRLILVKQRESEEPKLLSWSLKHPHPLIRILARHTHQEMKGQRWRATAHAAIETAIKEWHEGEREVDC